MKFASIYFAEKTAGGSVVWNNVPEFLRELYYLKFYKQAWDKTELFSAEGYILHLPFNSNEKNNRLFEKYLQKELRHLISDGAEFFSFQRGINIPDYVKAVSGKALICLLANYLVSSACVKNGKSFEQSDIAVIDGGNCLTDILLNVTAPKATKVWLYTLRPESIKPVLEEIFAQTGLCIGVCSSLNSQFIKNSDIIINLSKNRGYTASFGKNAVYIDIVDDRQNTNKLIRSRKDITVMRNFNIIFNDKKISAGCAEAALCVINKPFRDMIFNGVTQERLKKAAEEVSYFNLKPYLVLKSL